MASKEEARLTEDLDGLIDELQRETDRGMALLGAAFLDECLKNLLRAYFVDDHAAQKKLFDPFGPLGTFDARISTAYLLGLLSKTERTDFETLKKIRNEFAHNLHGVSFASEPIVRWIGDLRLARALVTIFDDVGDAPRDRVVTSVLLLWYAIQKATAGQQHLTPKGEEAFAEVLIQKVRQSKVGPKTRE